MDETAIARCAVSAVTGLTLRFLRLLRWRVPVEALHHLRRWRDLITSLQRHPRGRDVMMALFAWYLAGTPHDPEPLRAAMSQIDEENPAMRTALDWWLEMAAGRAMARGEQEGLQAGLIEGRREVLLDQLTFRFGALPAALRARLDVADADALQRWSRRLLDAASLGDVFAET
jgi:hypothetical protein